MLRRADRHDGDGDGDQDERDEDQRVVQRALRREDEREQQDRAELPHGARGEQVGAEATAHLAGVGEDRQQGPDRRRREGGSDVDERDDHAGQGEHAAQGVGDRQRHRPAQQPQAQRHAADAGKVDLVAGEEEQHAEAEVAEELRERVDLGEIEQLRPDQHAQDQLDHDHREEQAAPAGHGDQRPRHRRGRDDREERAGVDLEDRGRARPPVVRGSPCSCRMRLERPTRAPPPSNPTAG